MKYIDIINSVKMTPENEYRFSDVFELIIACGIPETEETISRAMYRKLLPLVKFYRLTDCSCIVVYEKEIVAVQHRIKSLTEFLSMEKYTSTRDSILTVLYGNKNFVHSKILTEKKLNSNCNLFYKLKYVPNYYEASDTYSIETFGAKGVYYKQKSNYLEVDSWDKLDDGFLIRLKNSDDDFKVEKNTLYGKYNISEPE